MSRAQGLKAFLAALCFSAVIVDSASAQEVNAVPQDGTVASPDLQDGSQAGWLTRGRGQNRIVNPFRATPAPGTDRALNTPGPAGTVPLSRGLQPNVVAPLSRVPENAMLDPYGKGWTCVTGFRRQGAQCVALQIPANATLDLTGHGWTCDRGYQRQGQGCVAVPVPDNATLVGRNTWACNYGFRRAGQGCVTVVVPEHALLDKAGHAWACEAGYTRRDQICIDDATARLQQQADQVVNARPGPAPAAKGRPGVSVNSGENRQGRTSKATVVIGRF